MVLALKSWSLSSAALSKEIIKLLSLLGKLFPFLEIARNGSKSQASEGDEAVDGGHMAGCSHGRSSWRREYDPRRRRSQSRVRPSPSTTRCMSRRALWFLGSRVRTVDG